MLTECRTAFSQRSYPLRQVITCRKRRIPSIGQFYQSGTATEVTVQIAKRTPTLLSPWGEGNRAWRKRLHDQGRRLRHDRLNQPSAWLCRLPPCALTHPAGVAALPSDAVILAAALLNSLLDPIPNLCAGDRDQYTSEYTLKVQTL
jgi:hypothetical protein